MGLAVTTDTAGVRVGSYGCQGYLAAAIMTGYALGRLDGWQRVAARWITPNFDLVPRGHGLDHLHLCRGPKLLRALEQWARMESDGGPVLVASHDAIRLGRQFKECTGGLALLLVAYDGICAPRLDRDWTAAEAASLVLLLHASADQLDAVGYPGGWADEVREIARVCEAAAIAGTVVRLG